MTSPEGTRSRQDSHESVGEGEHQVYKARGEKVMTAAERAAKAKRLEEIRRRREEIQKLLDEAAAAKQPVAEKPASTSSEMPAKQPEQPEQPGEKTEQDKATIVAETTKKAKNNHVFRNVLIAVTSIALAGAIGIGLFTGPGGKKSESAPAPAPTPAVEAVKDTGEKDELRLQYDYTEWADFGHKSSHNAYGTDYSDCYGDDEKTTAGFLQKAESMPEALASYKSIFFEDEQKELGIWDMTEKELEEYMSDENSPEAAAMQQKLLDAIAVTLNDKENTKWEYNYENEDENSYYVIWEDANSDGTQTPDEMHLGYSTVKRHNAPQANLYRRDKDGNWVKVLDLNLYCGFQPNTPTDTPPDVPLIPDEEPSVPVSSTPAPSLPVSPPSGPVPSKPASPPSPPVSPSPAPSAPPSSVAPKDPDNLTRIDKQIKEDIETDVHTGDIIITPTDDVTEVEEITEEPAAEDYHEPAPTIVKNEAAEEAEPIQGDAETGVPSQISPENDYSQDRGGANEANAPEEPVVADQEAQDKADAAEIPIDEAPGVDDIGGQDLNDIGGQDLNDILADLGIY